MGDLGLILALALDNTQAQVDTGEFGKTLGGLGEMGRQAGQKLGSSFGDTNKNLLSNRESARLLTEEFGIRMPRAVTSAVAEIMPAIGGMGTALLGVFAVKELYAFEKGLTALYADFDGVTQAVGLMRDVARENLQIINELAGASQAYARQEVTNALHRIMVQGAEIKVMEDNRDAFEGMMGPMAAIFDKVTGKTKAADDAIKGFHDDQKAAFELAQTVAKDMEKDSEKAAKAAAKHAKAEKEVEFQIFGTGKQMGTYAVAIDGVTKAVDVDVVSLRLWESEMERALTVLPLVQQNLQGLVTPISQVNYAVHSSASFWKEMAQAMDLANKSVAEGIASNAKGAAGLMQELGLKREYAGFMAIYESAKGFEDLEAWDFWGAAQAFASAAEFGIAAGTGSRHRTATGGAGTAGSRPGGGGGGAGGGYGAPPGTLAPGAAGGAGRLAFGSGIIVVHGSADLHQFVAGLVNGAVDRGITVRATSSQRGAPVGH